MRELKFRCWNDKAKVMYYDINLMGGHACKDGHWLCYSKKDAIMQYTELKDKKGKEIYEGDILLERDGTYIRRLQVCFGMFWHVTGDSRDGVDDEGGEAVGYYLKDYYGINTYPENKGCALCPNYSDYLEIGGNIYENPELLKEQ
jgi:uncharacterized phage protein (TIGR01671 family)